MNTTPIKPLGSRVLVRRIAPQDVTESGIHLPDVAKEHSQHADVINLGTGGYDEQGKPFTFTVKPGDRVLIGKYNGTPVGDDENLLILLERDILGVFEKSETASAKRDRLAAALKEHAAEDVKIQAHIDKMVDVYERVDQAVAEDHNLPFRHLAPSSATHQEAAEILAGRYLGRNDTDRHNMMVDLKNDNPALHASVWNILAEKRRLANLIPDPTPDPARELLERGLVPRDTAFAMLGRATVRVVQDLLLFADTVTAPKSISITLNTNMVRWVDGSLRLSDAMVESIPGPVTPEEMKQIELKLIELYGPSIAFIGKKKEDS